MIKVLKSLGCIAVLCSLFAFTLSTNFDVEIVKVKCMLQTTNYSGEGAYIVVSLLDENGKYVETLYMQGQDEKWYDSLESWWKSIGKSSQGIDAISGATVSPGARTTAVLNISSDKINSGYKLRFESAVEDKDYIEQDLEIALTTGNLQGKFEGTGYVRYVRLMAH